MSKRIVLRGHNEWYQGWLLGFLGLEAPGPDIERDDESDEYRGWRDGRLDFHKGQPVDNRELILVNIERGNVFVEVAEEPPGDVMRPMGLGVSDDGSFTLMQVRKWAALSAAEVDALSPEDFDRHKIAMVCTNWDNTEATVSIDCTGTTT